MVGCGLDGCPAGGSPGSDPILYPGSYSDWSRAGLPVVIGPEPGEPPAGQPASG